MTYMDLLSALPYDIKRLVYDYLMTDPVYLLSHDLKDAYLALYGKLYIHYGESLKTPGMLCTSLWSMFVLQEPGWICGDWNKIVQHLNDSKSCFRQDLSPTHVIGLGSGRHFSYTPGDVEAVLYPMLRARPLKNFT